MASTAGGSPRTSSSDGDKKVKVTQVASKPIPFTAFQALWVPGTTRICALGSNDSGFGVIQLYNLTSNHSSPTSPKKSSITTVKQTPTRQQQPRLVLQSETEKKIQFKSGTFRASPRSSTLPHLLTGDFEGRVGLWDLSRAEVPVWMFRAHEDVVNCIDGVGSRTGRPEFVTGGRDGTVKLWDMRQDHKAAGATGSGSGVLGKPLSTMASLKKQVDGHDVWCVNIGVEGLGNDDEMLVVAGYDNGDLRVMDLRMGQAVFETNLQHGICSAELSPRRQGQAAGSRSLSSLVATTLEGSMHVFDLVDGQFKAMTSTNAGSNATATVTEETVAVQSGDDSTLWQIRHVPQRPDILAVTDGGGYMHLYEHGDEKTLTKHLGSHKLAEQGILSLEFSEDLEGLFVGCDLDSTLRVGMLHL
ncbi:hypothetical protein BGZ96_011935 [Linnemannia gamsii]|uniref:WD40 repeat-like protein n=1 Tax=Linnemannia gamsii TaxID=64522 RepID=A0ABQ7JRS9_9FUNG|nr:hypothetical protein BGZ96_011935 [Linnemannia gamsii]